MFNLKPFTVLYSAVFLLMYGVGMIVAVLPGKMLEVSGSITVVGSLAAAFAVPYILFQIPLGTLSDRFGHKPFLVGGYFICALTGILFFFADSPFWLIAGRVLHGLGETPIWATAPAILSLIYPTDKGKFMGGYNGAIHLGLTIGSLTVFVATHLIPTQFLFLIFSGLSLLGGLFIWAGLKTPHSEARKTSVTIEFRFSAFILRPEIRIVLGGILLYGVGYGLFLTVIPAFLIQVKQADQRIVGSFFALFYVAIGVAQIIAGSITDRVGYYIPMIIGLLPAAAGLALFPFCSIVWTMFMLMTAGFGIGIFGMAAIAFLNDQASESLKGSASGAYYLFWGMGYFGGPIVFGWTCERGYFDAGFTILSLIFLFMAIMILFNGLLKKGDERNFLPQKKNEAKRRGTPVVNKHC